MPKITFNQAKKFLDNITKKDKVAIIHHDDGDGFCSGILFYDHCISRGATVKTFPYSLSKTSLKTLPLKPFNKIIITDISTKAIREEIEFIKHKQIFLTDHHPKFPLPKKILQLITTDQGYIPSSRTTYELTRQKKWLALIGTISDSANLYKENTKFINDFLKEQNITLEEFKKNYVYPLSNTITYFKDTPQKIFPILSKLTSLKKILKLKKYSKEIEKEIEKFAKQYETKKEEFNDISFFQYKPKFSISTPLINVITTKYPEKIHILLSQKGDKINISTRDQSEKIGVNKLLEKATKNLENAKSGGHPRASGGQIQKKDLEKFKQNIKNLIKK
ncbi:DHH family phosphoesterase [Candidatus Pacearchaeota archaeon]|nr:DHH family phosphoesterase [Candidatus Pacearchaeota archaeon]